jgi:gliding motility-associated-like protein
VNVHKPLVNNIVSLLSGGTDTTICDGANPNRLPGTLPSGGTNLPGDYAYEWLSSSDNSTWNPVASSGTSQGYDPPALNVTTYYKRKVLSGACIDISAATIKVTVLPLIANNTLTTPAVICKGSSPKDPLTGSTPTGGDGIYKYLWEQSIDGGTTWTAATGVNNDPSGNYQPPSLSVPTKYKRKVNSGAGNCCTDISNIIEVQINSLPTTVADAGTDDVANSPFKDYTLNANMPNPSYETGVWSSIQGSKDFADDKLPTTKVYGLAERNIFIWKITNYPCISQDTVTILYENIVIPEGFSPNGDPNNINEYFEILGLDTLSQEIDLSIVNSAGSEVFHSTNKDGNEWKLWDGKNSKGIDLPEGTYYYILKVVYKEFNSNETEKYSGFIVLKRR